jgi:hypothetical protein
MIGPLRDSDEKDSPSERTKFGSKSAPTMAAAYMNWAAVYVC